MLALAGQLLYRLFQLLLLLLLLLFLEQLLAVGRADKGGRHVLDSLLAGGQRLGGEIIRTADGQLSHVLLQVIPEHIQNRHCVSISVIILQYVSDLLNHHSNTSGRTHQRTYASFPSPGRKRKKADA